MRRVGIQRTNGGGGLGKAPRDRTAHQDMRSLLNDDETLATDEINEPKLEIFYADPDDDDAPVPKAAPESRAPASKVRPQ